MFQSIYTRNAATGSNSSEAAFSMKGETHMKKEKIYLFI